MGIAEGRSGRGEDAEEFILPQLTRERERERLPIGGDIDADEGQRHRHQSLHAIQSAGAQPPGRGGG